MTKIGACGIPLMEMRDQSSLEKGVAGFLLLCDIVARQYRMIVAR